MKENKFKNELTQEEIKNEIKNLSNFFDQIPHDLKSETAIAIIFNAALLGSFELTHGLGLIEEAKFRFRKVVTRKK